MIFASLSLTSFARIALLLFVGAQEDALSLRVLAVESDTVVVVDRGRRDRLVVGDPVVLDPRVGGRRHGSVVSVERQTARVELSRPGPPLAPGVPGEVRIPHSRPFPADLHARIEPAPPPPDHPPWMRRDDWSPEDPLLQGLRAVRPERRPTTLRGRLRLRSIWTGSTAGGRGDSLTRLGAALTWENPFQRGGALRSDLELVGRTADYPPDTEENELELRLGIFSYRWGGTRFQSDRFEVGRFFQEGVPEFGRLDGGQWVRRTEGGDRFGISLGFLPVPNEDLETFRDFQLAAFYEWTVDPDERWLVTGGVQKTFHDGDADRDLLLGRIRYDPANGWDLFGSLWVDLYTSGDAKGSGLGLTRALLTTRNDGTEGGLEASYEHSSFPAIDRFEFFPPAPDELVDGRYDRLALKGWVRGSEPLRWTGEVGGWADEDDQGLDVEIGADLRRWPSATADTRITAFGVRGEHTLSRGLRGEIDWNLDRGLLGLAYEFTDQHLEGFSAGFDDLLEHRLRVRYQRRIGGGWSLATWAEGTVFDRDGAWTIGISIEKGF